MGSFQDKITAAILTRIRSRRKSASVLAESHPRPGSAIAPAKLREARFSDFIAVAELKQRGGIAPDSLENWERLWRRNPALAPGTVERPIGWVLEADGAVVGYLGNISLRCWYGDQALSAVTAHGFVVDPPYRAVGLSLAAAFFRQKSVDLYVSTSAIEAVGKIALAFKSAPLPQPDYDTVLFWVLQPYPFAQSLVTKLNLSPALSRIGTAVGALAISTDKILRQRWPRSSASSLAVSEISPEQIGDDFQSLWAEKLRERPRLFAERTPATLRWHFEIPGDIGLARVICCRQDGKLVGYAVVRSDTDPENGLRKSLIADLIARQDDPAVLRALWSAAYDYAKQAGSHVLEVQGFPPGVRQIFSDWKPYQRKLPACPYYYKATDPLLQQTLAGAAAWYACPFDGDATLIRPSYSAPAGLATAEVPEKAAGEILADLSPAAEQERTGVC